MFSLRAPLGAIILAILVGLGTVAGISVAQASDELNIKCRTGRLGSSCVVVSGADFLGFPRFRRALDIASSRLVSRRPVPIPVPNEKGHRPVQVA